MLTSLPYAPHDPISPELMCPLEPGTFYTETVLGRALKPQSFGSSSFLGL